MRVTRRSFVKTSTAAGVGLLVAGRPRRAHALFAQSPQLLKFGAGQKLRLFGIDIPLATSVGAGGYDSELYRIAMRQFTDQLHPNLEPTTLRGYTNAANDPEGYAQKHLEGAILAKVGTPVRVQWVNQLPLDMPLPVDMTLVQPYTFGQALGNDRAAPHLHGGLVPWPSDGGPFHWFNNPGNGGPVKGPSVVNWLDGTDDYWYPNIQSPRFMWYHDHAVGITRLNAYAGLATGYILTDDTEGLLPSAGPTLMKMLGIPEGDLTRQVHLVVQDKIFFPNPYSGSGGSTGDLWYPDTYDTGFFGPLAPGSIPIAGPSLVPEFWGDTMLMNGTVFPYMEVEPRRYRFRILNACNTRFLSLRLVPAAGTSFPANAEPDTNKRGPAMTLIGTEGGFLDGTIVPKGVVYDNRQNTPLVLAPAERADLIVDFSAVPASAGMPPMCFILHNDAPVPFPGGTPLGDFHPGNNKLAAPPAPGYGPNTRTLLQFRVVPLGSLTGSASPDPPIDPGWELPPSAPPTTTPVRTRDLGLYETVDEYGRLAQNLGEIAGPLTQLDAPTEVVEAGTVEIWRVFNLSADTHPIHFHYFNVRVLSRQRAAMTGRGVPNLSAHPFPPEPCELGWKETVRFNSGECTTLLVEVPPTTGLAPVPVPNSPRLATYYPGYEGAEYVWHCHILEHEEHDMMRPLVVQEPLTP